MPFQIWSPASVLIPTPGCTLPAPRRSTHTCICFESFLHCSSPVNKPHKACRCLHSLFLSVSPSISNGSFRALRELSLFGALINFIMQEQKVELSWIKSGRAGLVCLANPWLIFYSLCVRATFGTYMLVIHRPAVVLKSPRGILLHRRFYSLLHWCCRLHTLLGVFLDVFSLQHPKAHKLLFH